MKITRRQLRQIIREEIENLDEGFDQQTGHPLNAEAHEKLIALARSNPSARERLKKFQFEDSRQLSQEYLALKRHLDKIPDNAARGFAQDLKEAFDNFENQFLSVFIKEYRA